MREGRAAETAGLREGDNSMKYRIAFRKKVEEFLRGLDQNALAYNKDEYWMIFSEYEFLEYYSFENRLWNTCIALPLARGLHDGTYRRATITRNGTDHRLPYVIHCLRVCRMLAYLNLPVPREEQDILLAAALCHDMIEDLPFEKNGRELTEEYCLDPKVYEIVRLVSKRKNFTEEETREHFRAIQENRLALLVKLSDRSQNVEDLYNMRVDKIHEYIDETNRYILPMCQYGMTHYPELWTTLRVLQDKILCLTQTAETMVDHYETREQELRRQLKELRAENAKLFETLGILWKR